MNAYSKDLRLRVLAAVDRGTAYGEVSRLFGVSLATIGRYVRRRRETGEVAARPSPGRTPSVCRDAQERRALWRQLEENREATPRSATASCGKSAAGRGSASRR